MRTTTKTRNHNSTHSTPRSRFGTVVADVRRAWGERGTGSDLPRLQGYPFRQG